MTVALETPLWVWYLMRGSGLVALVLLSLVVALGVVGATRWQSARWPRLVTAGLHRNLSLLALCLLAIHVGTALVDGWVGLRWFGAVVPFVATYRPLWVGLGVLAGDLVLAVVVTSLLRRHLGYRSWRAVHRATWLLWPLALAHGLTAGTDALEPWALATTAACAAMVVAAVLWRLHAGAAPHEPTPSGAPARVPARALGAAGRSPEARGAR